MLKVYRGGTKRNLGFVALGLGFTASRVYAMLLCCYTGVL